MKNTYQTKDPRLESSILRIQDLQAFLVYAREETLGGSLRWDYIPSFLDFNKGRCKAYRTQVKEGLHTLGSLTVIRDRTWAASQENRVYDVSLKQGPNVIDTLDALPHWDRPLHQHLVSRLWKAVVDTSGPPGVDIIKEFKHIMDGF